MYDLRAADEETMARFRWLDQTYKWLIMAHGYPRARIYSDHIKIVAGWNKRLADCPIIMKNASVFIAEFLTYVPRLLRLFCRRCRETSRVPYTEGSLHHFAGTGSAKDHIRLCEGHRATMVA